MTLMEFVINLVVNGDAAAKEIANIKKEADDAGKSMSDMEARANIAGQRIGDGMKTAATSLKNVAAMYQAAALGMFMFAKSVADGADELMDFSELNNVAVETVQKLGYAAIENGSSSEDARASLQGLNKTIGEASNGVGRGSKMFQKFGISLKNADGSMKSTDEVMGSVADKMKAMSQQEAIGMAGKLGISESMVTLLRNGSDGLQQIMKDQEAFGILTTEQLEKTNEFNELMKKLWQFANYVKTTIGIAIMPAITEMVNKFITSSGGIEALKVKAQEFGQKLAVVLPQIAKVAAAFATVVIAGAKLMDWLAQGVGGWDNFAYALVGVKTLTASGLLAPLIQGFIRLGAVMLANPIGLVVAAIVAGAYLVWTNWDRIIGFLKSAWQGAKDSLMSVVNGIKQYWDDLKNSVINNVNEIIDAANRLPFVDIGHIGGVAGGTGSTASPATSQGVGAGNSYRTEVTVNANTAQAVDRAVSPNFARQTATAGYGGVFA